MNAQTEMHVRLHKPWSTIARVVWVSVVSLVIVLFTAGLLSGLEQLGEVCLGRDCHPMQLNPAQAEFNHQLGLSLDFYAWYTTLSFAIFGFVFFVIAWLIFWRRSDDWMVLFVSLWLVLFGAGVNAVIPDLGGILFVLAGAGIFPLFCLFPDGRFVPSWIRWLVVIWIAFGITTRFVLSPPPTQGIAGGPPDPGFQAAMLIGIAAQVYRYRRVSTPFQRQQTKWAVLGFAGWFTCLVILLLVLALNPALRRPGLPEFVFSGYVFSFAGLFPVLFIPAGIGFSILRYRLWDIDVIIRKTLVYSLLTGLLSLFYFSGVALVQGILTADRNLQTAGNAAVSGPPPAIVIVLTTLLIAALFNPLRRRVQDFIDRRFYRQKYDAEKALAEFSAVARSGNDLAQLSERLTTTVQETLQPQHISLWLKPAATVLRSGSNPTGES